MEKVLCIYCGQEMTDAAWDEWDDDDCPENHTHVWATEILIEEIRAREEDHDHVLR